MSKNQATLQKSIMHNYSTKLRGSGILFKTPSEYYLLVQRGTTVPAPLKWAVPGGKIHIGEQPRNAAEREIVEELGCMPDQYEWTGLVTVQPTPSGKGIFYTYLYEIPNSQMKDWKINIGPTHPHGHESNAFKWLKINEIKELISEGKTISSIPFIN